MELKLGSIPVRIHPGFLLMTLLLGSDRDPAKIAIWSVVVLLSVLVHELGHALVGRALGLVPRIDLHGMGGTTSFGAHAPLGRARRVLISVAGPFAGFTFAAILFGAQIAGARPAHPLALHALSLFFFVNVSWGIFNLLPMLPLDGGDVLREVVGEKIARVVSVVAAAAIAVFAIRRGAWWVLYLGVLFAFQNVQALRQLAQRRADEKLATALTAAHAALEKGTPNEAVALLRPAFVETASADLRQVALRVWVAALFATGAASEATALIERERALVPPEDLEHYARALRESGSNEDAAKVERLRAAPPELQEFRA
jgi:hypothetical protein